MTTKSMSNKEVFDLIIIYMGTGTTWLLTILDLVLSIAVGIGTLLYTGVKLMESWKRFRARIEIEKEGDDEHRTKEN